MRVTHTSDGLMVTGVENATTHEAFTAPEIQALIQVLSRLHYPLEPYEVAACKRAAEALRGMMWNTDAVLFTVKS